MASLTSPAVLPFTWVQDPSFNNKSGGVANVASNTGWAFFSNNITDDGIINNEGIFNVTVNTAFEAAYNQLATGTLNVKDVFLNLQNAQAISGTVNLMPAGATGPATLNVNEFHGTQASFSNTSFPGNSGFLSIAGNVGGTPSASFSGVTAANTQLNVGGGSPGSIDILGDTTFFSVGISGGGTLNSISNGVLTSTRG